MMENPFRFLVLHGKIKMINRQILRLAAQRFLSGQGYLKILMYLLREIHLTLLVNIRAEIILWVKYQFSPLFFLFFGRHFEKIA